MDHGQRAVLRGQRHALQQLGVVDHLGAGVGHEELPAADALGEQPQQVVADLGLLVAGRHDGVQPEVDDAAGAGVLAPPQERLVQGAVRFLLHEVDDGGGAAVGGGDRAGGEVVGGARGEAVDRIFEVGVGVDAAGQQERAAGVDGAVGRPVGAVADGRDHAVTDEDVRPDGRLRGDDGAAADEGGGCGGVVHGGPPVQAA